MSAIEPFHALSFGAAFSSVEAILDSTDIFNQSTSGGAHRLPLHSSVGALLVVGRLVDRPNCPSWHMKILHLVH